MNARVAVVVALASSTALALNPLPCDENGMCAGGLSCVEGFCVTACTTDAACPSGQGCVAGGCYPVVSVPYVKDYGLSSTGAQPTCALNSDCDTTALRCVAGRCQLFNGTGMAATAQTCTSNAACPGATGYTCVGGTCTGGTCTMNSDCVAAHPVDGLICVAGRCSSRCATSATCCASPQLCSVSPQGVCHVNPSDVGGVCGATIATGRIVALQLANARADQVRENIVFVTEGVRTNGQEMRNAEDLALKATRWMATHADVFNAIWATQQNVFLLELTDNTADIDRHTLFGRFQGPSRTMIDMPGSGAQQRFQALNGLARFVSATTGVTVPFTTLSPRMFPMALYHTGDGRLRAFALPGSHSLMTHDFNRAAPNFSNPPGGGDKYYVFQHEFGHLSGNAVGDEYDNDSPTRGVFGGWDNIMPRSVATGCTICDGSDDSIITFLSGSPWSTFVNTLLPFPSTANDFVTVGHYEGGDQMFPRAAMRSQLDCVMRQQTGRQLFCPACRQSLAVGQIGAGSGAFRFLDLDRMPSPNAAGFGPIHGVASSSGLKKTFYTRFAVGGRVLSVVDHNLLSKDGAGELVLDGLLGAAELPLSVLVDDPGSQVLLPFFDVGSPARSGLLAVSVAGPPVALPTVTVANMVAAPALDAARRKVFTASETVVSGVRTTSLVTIDLSTGPPTVTASTPPGLPRFSAQPAIAPGAGLAFFPVGRITPAQPSCNATQCQIWVLDANTSGFLAGAMLTVDTTGGEPGISAIAIGNPLPTAPLNGELFIAVTERTVSVWRTADVRAGITAPISTFAHGLGVTGTVSAVAYVAAGERLLMGNLDGRLASFGVRGLDAPAGRAITFAGFAAGMQLRDIYVSPDSSAYVALGGYFPSARAGLLATLDPLGNVIYELPLAALGIGRPSIAVDETRGVVFSNATVSSGDIIPPVFAPYRTPVLRARAAP